MLEKFHSSQEVFDASSVETLEHSERRLELEPSINRQKRHMEVANMIAILEGDKPLEPSFRKKTAAIIEGRGWNSLFSKLEDGDKLVTFIVPDDFYSVKNLNDKIFGQQGTDTILDHQKIVLRRVMEAYGFDTLRQDYKTSIFRVEQNATEDMFDMICQTVQAEMDLYVRKQLRELKDKLVSNKSKEEVVSLHEIEAFEKQMDNRAFHVSYGTSRVGDNGYESVEMAVIEGLAASRQAQTLAHEGVYGVQFSAEGMLEAVDETRRIREQLLAYGSIGGEIIFSHDAVTKTYAMNRPIVQALRKETLAPKSEKDRKAIELLKQYKKLLNLLDTLKPYTHGEITGEDAAVGYDVRAIVQEEGVVANDMRSNVFAHEREVRENASAILQRDQKDFHCTSPAVFHREALKIPQCTYISLDVLDVGVDLFHEYERAMQKIEHTNEKDKAKQLREIMAVAGDSKTIELRIVRERIQEYCKEKMSGEYAGKSVPLLVGGDEVTLAFPSSLVTKEFLFGLQEATGTRVAEAKAERLPLDRTDKDSEEQLYEFHALALKEAEQAITIAKKIEGVMANRKRGNVALESDSASLTGLFDLIKKGFVIREEDGFFYLMTKEEELPLTIDHDRISVTKEGSRMFLYGAALVFLLAFFIWK